MSPRAFHRRVLDLITGRSLDQPALRARMLWVDRAAIACVALVAVGLVLEDHTVVDVVLSEHSAARLVTLGVIGEFVVHWLHSRAAKREQVLSDAENAEQALEIARLSAAAAEANARAAEAWERVAWRKITDEKRVALIAKLSPLAGQPFVVVLACFEGEAADFAWQVSDLLDAAGWVRRGPYPYDPGDDLMQRMHAVWNGLHVDSNFDGRGSWPDRPDEEQRLLCVTLFLAEAFREVGFDAIPIGASASIGPAVPEPPDTSIIRIRVCRKLF